MLKHEGEPKQVAGRLAERARERSRYLGLGMLSPPLVKDLCRIIGQRTKEWPRRSILPGYERQLDQLLQRRSTTLETGMSNRPARRHLLRPRPDKPCFQTIISAGDQLRHPVRLYANETP